MLSVSSRPGQILSFTPPLIVKPERTSFGRLTLIASDWIWNHRDMSFKQVKIDWHTVSDITSCHNRRSKPYSIYWKDVPYRGLFHLLPSTSIIWFIPSCFCYFPKIHFFFATWWFSHVKLDGKVNFSPTILPLSKSSALQIDSRQDLVSPINYRKS